VWGGPRGPAGRLETVQKVLTREDQARQRTRQR
jgi:hypothetical protein